MSGKLRTCRPFNPTDYLFYVHHRCLRRKGLAGHGTAFALDLEGRIDVGVLRRAIGRMLRRHPVLTAQVKHSLLWGRPYWLMTDVDREPPASIIDSILSYADLREESAWREVLEERCQQGYRATWDLAGAAHIRFDYYELPEDRSRLCLRWPHALMDGEGALRCVYELSQTVDALLGGQADGDLEDDPRGLWDDAQIVDPIRALTLVGRWNAARRALRQVPRPKADSAAPLIAPPYPRVMQPRYLYRSWDSTATRRIRDNAGLYAPPGDAHHARYLALCVVRAVHRLYAAQGVRTEVYYLPFPLSLTLLTAGGSRWPQRPMPGNYLVSATFAVDRGRIEDKRAAGALMFEQFRSYQQGAMHLGQWSFLWWLSLMRVWMYEGLFSLPVGTERLCSGFSYMGDLMYSFRRIGKARVVDRFGLAPMSMPPGLSPFFGKTAGRINMSLTWMEPVLSESIARQYADYIEEELLE